VASGLTSPDESEPACHALEFQRSGARHSRFRWCPPATGSLAR
jgi:hypothetical protein